MCIRGICGTARMVGAVTGVMSLSKVYDGEAERVEMNGEILDLAAADIELSNSTLDALAVGSQLNQQESTAKYIEGEANELAKWLNDRLVGQGQFQTRIAHDKEMRRLVHKALLEYDGLDSAEYGRALMAIRQSCVANTLAVSQDTVAHRCSKSFIYTNIVCLYPNIERSRY